MKKITPKQIQIIIISVIFIIILAISVKLIIWNNSKYKPLESVETDYDFSLAESEDYITYMDPELRANIEEDGITTVLFLGDEILTDYTGETGIPETFKSLFPNSEVISVGFSGTRTSPALPSYSTDTPIDAFSLYWLSVCMAAREYSLQDAALASLSDADKTYAENLDRLKTVDFMKIDSIVISQGLHDYLEGAVIANGEDFNDITTQSGALKSSIELLQQAYPHIRLIVSTPSFCMIKQDDGSYEGADVVNTAYGRLSDYMVADKNIAVWTNTTFLDNFYSIAIDSENYKDYLEPNLLFPNAAARKIIAQRIAKALTPPKDEHPK